MVEGSYTVGSLLDYYERHDGVLPKGHSARPNNFDDYLVLRMMGFEWPAWVCRTAYVSLRTGASSTSRGRRRRPAARLKSTGANRDLFSRACVDSTLRLAAREAASYQKQTGHHSDRSLDGVRRLLLSAFPSHGKELDSFARAAISEAHDAKESPAQVVAPRMLVYDSIATECARLIAAGEPDAADELCEAGIAQLRKLDDDGVPLYTARLSRLRAAAERGTGNPTLAIDICERIETEYGSNADARVRAEAAQADSFRRSTLEELGSFRDAESLSEEIEDRWKNDSAPAVRAISATEMAARRSLLENRGKLTESAALAEEIWDKYQDSDVNNEQIATADAVTRWAATLSRQHRHDEAIRKCDLVFHTFAVDESGDVRIWVARALAVKMFTLSASGKRFAAIKVRFKIFGRAWGDPAVAAFRIFSDARSLLDHASEVLAASAAKLAAGTPPRL